MSLRPAISVIIPVYNGEPFLAEAMRSVLAQTLPPEEIIVVDDGSTDGTARLVETWQNSSTIQLHYRYQSNRGPSAARNRGLEMARCDLIAFLDADDMWDPAKLSVQHSLLCETREAALVWGHTQLFSVVDGRQKILGEPILRPQLGSALFRRAAFDRVGAFDESMRYSEDLDWFLRARELNADIYTHSEIAVWYRLHENNSWLGQPNGFAKTLSAVKRKLERQRSLSSQTTGPGGTDSAYLLGIGQ